MSIIRSSGAGESTGFYNGVVSQSMRFNSQDSPELSYTPSTGNRKTYTLSVWVKLGTNLTSYRAIFGTGGGANRDRLQLFNNQKVVFNINDGSDGRLTTNAYLRDLSAWYHLMAVLDTTQSTDTDRMKIYINGEEASYSEAVYPSEDYEGRIGLNAEHFIGNSSADNLYMDGLLAEFNYTDGVANLPTAFGETKNGVWIPKKYTGSYGNNGFRMEFKNTTVGSGSSTSCGADTSGQDNHLNSTNISSADCNILDCPENNFATMFELAQGGTTTNDMTFSEANTTLSHTTSGQWQGHKGSFPVKSGKWYYEVQIHTRPTHTTQNYGIGFFRADKYNALYYGLEGNLAFGMYGNNARTYKGTGTTSYGTAADADGEVYQVAVDFDAEKIWFGLEGTFMASGDPAAGSNASISSFDAGTYVPLCSMYAYGAPLGKFIYNFGQDGTFAGTKSLGNNTDQNGHGNFLFSVPSGFLAMCTANITDPTIGPNSNEQADDNFNTVTYTGNATDTNITTVGFQPDWVWVKNRSNAYHHGLFDSVRGANKSLITSDQSAETSHTEQLTAFLSNGFSVGDNSDSGNFVNINTHTYVAWNWKAGTTSGIDTTGQDITPSGYSFNQDAGFSIVKYTGNKTDQQGVPHGLGAKPDWVIIKDRDNASTQWVMAFPQISGNDYIYFLVDAKSTDSGNVFYFTPTTTTVEISDHDEVNKNSTDYIMYCFRSIEGYSKIGTYTSNNSTDNAYVYTGFRPAFVLVKTLNASQEWAIIDNKRDTINDNSSNVLYPNYSNAEGTDGSNIVDLLSNGFKIRATASFGYGTATYVYVAFAEQPFKYANAR